MKENVAVVAGALLVAVVFAGAALYQAQAKHQPLAYNHKKHIDAGLECGNCHTGIADADAHARLPTIDVCMGCHGSEDNPKTQPIRDYARQGRPIPWKRVYEVPAHVYFSHRRHVALGKLECAACHGDMPHKETPVSRQLIPIRMTRCIACHRERGVTTDCLACHR